MREPPPAKERALIEELPAQTELQAGAPVFLVAAGDGPSGRLVVERRARRAGWAQAVYATGVEEVDAAQLHMVRIE